MVTRFIFSHLPRPPQGTILARCSALALVIAAGCPWSASAGFAFAPALKDARPEIPTTPT